MQELRKDMHMLPQEIKESRKHQLGPAVQQPTPGNNLEPGQPRRPERLRHAFWNSATLGLHFERLRSGTSSLGAPKSAATAKCGLPSETRWHAWNPELKYIPDLLSNCGTQPSPLSCTPSFAVRL